MIYVTSDLHGLKLTKLKALLKKAYFSKNDWLFVLGDVIDRQNDGGVAILGWLLEQPNAQLILGNHEAIFDRVNEAIGRTAQKDLKIIYIFDFQPAFKRFSRMFELSTDKTAKSDMPVQYGK